MAVTIDGSANTVTGAASSLIGSALLASTNGYYKVATSGLIIQWGSVSVPAGTVTVTFPIAFSTAILNIQITIEHAGVTDFFTPKIESKSTTQVVLRNTDATTAIFNWLAIGN